MVAVERLEKESSGGREVPRDHLQLYHLLGALTIYFKTFWDKHERPCHGWRYRMEGKWLEAMQVPSLAHNEQSRYEYGTEHSFQKVVTFI
jgi:hypothetical protein